MPKEGFSGKKQNQFRLPKGTYKLVHMTLKESVDDFTFICQRPHIFLEEL